MFKALATIAFALAVSPAFGVSIMVDGEYGMSGTWVAEDASTGTWTADLKITKNVDSYDFEENLTIKLPDGKEMKDTMNWTTKGNGTAGFFDMEAGRANIGWGFCDKETCQIQGEGKTGESFGETYSFGSAGITVVGHKADTHGKVAWKGTVTKK